MSKRKPAQIQPLDLLRQGGLVLEELRGRPIIVVGCGTTGSWIAHFLLRMGFTRVAVVDPDKVEPHNGPAQFHVTSTRVGITALPKVDSFALAMRALKLPEPETVWNIAISKKSRFSVEDTVILCVDSVQARKDILFAARKVRQIIDLRMGPEEGTVIFSPPASRKDYAATLKVKFATEPACGALALVTSGAGLAAATLGHWIAAERGAVKPKARLRWNFATGETFEEGVP